MPTPAAAGSAASASKIGKVDRGAAAATKKQPPAPPQRTNSIPHQELSKTSLQVNFIILYTIENDIMLDHVLIL